MITELLSKDGYILCNKQLAKTLGLHEAIILGELCAEFEYWKNSCGLTGEGYFFSTIENIEKNTTLSEKQQRNAISNLVSANILETKLIGLPAKKHFKINEKEIFKFLQNCETSSVKTTELDTTKLPTNNNKEKIINNSFIKEPKTQKRNYTAKPIVEIENVEKPKKKNVLEKSIELLLSYQLPDKTYVALIDYLEMKSKMLITKKDRKYVVSESSTKSLVEKKIIPYLELHTDNEVAEMIRVAISNKWASVFITDNKSKKTSSLFINIPKTDSTDNTSEEYKQRQKEWQEQMLKDGKQIEF